MAKKIRKKARKKIEKWHLGLLAFAAILTVMVVLGIMSGRSEPIDVFLGLLFEIGLYVAVPLVVLPVAWLIRRLKRADKAKDDDSPFD
ncbi:MAG: hypothetical protein JSV90_08975 [Methanobacteriota archaeon]|nr:MAG: hypothetical protein JSV90_08975 [Euryarchaeota archaeon]